jgi:DNA-binding NarL/FixJ family response regulator
VATSGASTAVAVQGRVIKLLVADDHPLMLEGIRKALSAAEDIEVVGQAGSGREALALAARTAPDVVLLDLRMPQMDGLACLQELKRMSPETRVIILSAIADRQQIRAALRLGADAYVIKSVNPVDLPSVVRQTMDGTSFTALVDDEADDVLAARANGLSDREIAILRALASGLSNQAIGRRLWVSEQTIKFHLRNIYRKLGLSNRTEAAHYAHETGLVDS